MSRSPHAAALLAGVALCTFPIAARADAMADAKALLARNPSRVTAWDGPATGPKAVTGKTIVVLAGDMKNGGILGVTNGIAEATKVTGWTVRAVDGAGSVSGRTAAFNQALTLKPDSIVIDGFDAIEQKPGHEDRFAALVRDRLVPLWTRFPGAEEVRVLRQAESDTEEPRIDMVLAIRYPSPSAVGPAPETRP